MAISRRIFLSYVNAAAVVAAVPIALTTATTARAAQNAQARAQFKYQEKPQDGKQCSQCALFVPGKSAADKGGCQIFPGDNEVSPTAYCIAFAPKPKPKA